MKNILIWAWNLAAFVIFIWAFLHFKTGKVETVLLAIVFTGGVVYRVYQAIKAGDPDNYWPEVLTMVSAFVLAMIGSDITL